MASGKQLSFMFGEVSPELQFKSDAVSYAQGLAKLRNKFVRRTGGVSNRPGLEYIKVASSQLNIPEVGGDPGIKAYTFWDPKNEEWKTVEYSTFAHPNGVDGNVLGFKDGNGTVIYPTELEEGIVTPTPKDIKFTALKEKIFITPPLTLFDATEYQGALKNDLTDLTFDYGSIQYYLASGVSAEITYVEGGPFLPVSYLIMANLDDGREAYTAAIETVGGTVTAKPTNNVAHPHNDLSMRIIVDLTSTTKTGIKSFTLYRGAGKDGLDKTYYKMVAKVPYDGAATSVSLSDYGADDPSLTPPTDKGETYIGSFRAATAATSYQQRLLMALKPGQGITNGIPSNFKSGDILASKLGAPEQIVAPLIYNDLGAFKFAVPVTDGTPVVALLGMERLIAFTERGVYVVRGGEQGMITPTQVNPTIISEEGCSTVIEPKMSGRRGYFVNNAHNKIMAIEFTEDANLKLYEASLFSSHFLLEDVHQIEVLGGGEDTIYLLRRDGKMIRMTSGEDGAHGFSLIETDGYIESIYRSKAPKKYIPNALTNEGDRFYDVLMCYVIRNGTRYLERLNVREDRFRQGEFYADHFVSFGKGLSKNGSEGYIRADIGTEMLTFPECRINIKSSTKITSPDPLVDPGVDFRIHFYYDENGVEKTLECEVDFDSEVVTGAGYEYNAVFTGEVPAVLLDVDSQPLTLAQKKALQTRWLPAINGIRGHSILSTIFFAAGGVNSGVDVAVVGDKEILSSPLNPNKPTLQIVRDSVTSDLYIDFGAYFAHGYIGLPYTSEFETLDIEAADNRTLTDTQKLINAVGVAFHETRGGFYGMPNRELSDMEELLPVLEDLDSVPANLNGHVTINVPAEYNQSGRINIKQVDPAPMTILAVYPKGISSGD